MARTLIIAEINGKDVRHLNATLDILDEPICMNIGVALMPFMEDGYYFLKEDSINKSKGLNEVETNYVEFFYRIRKANRESKKGNQKAKWINANWFSNRAPDQLGVIQRVFVAGKIFPIMMLIYSNDFVGFTRDSADAGKIEIKKTNPNSTVGKFVAGHSSHDRFDNRYVSIDNGKISIILPKINAMNIDYVALMYDFLINGDKTMISAVNGEFPNMEIYTIATDNVNLQKACWLKKDRIDKKDTWKKACMYIVEHKYQGILGPFGQIADFYELLNQKIISETKHKTRWLKGAKKLVGGLATFMEGQNRTNIIIDDDVEVILNELNVGICDYAITQFYELFYGKYKDAPLDTMEKAYKWDLAFVEHEQGVVAVPIYAKTDKVTIKKYQAMADHDGLIGYSSSLFSHIVPEFDEPWYGKVTDANFRIDLPMLMLWLDRHKPIVKDKNSPFYEKVDKNGFLLT